MQAGFFGFLANSERILLSVTVRLSWCITGESWLRIVQDSTPHFAVSGKGQRDGRHRKFQKLSQLPQKVEKPLGLRTFFAQNPFEKLTQRGARVSELWRALARVYDVPFGIYRHSTRYIHNTKVISVGCWQSNFCFIQRAAKNFFDIFPLDVMFRLSEVLCVSRFGEMRAFSWWPIENRPLRKKPVSIAWLTTKARSKFGSFLSLLSAKIRVRKLTEKVTHLNSHL